MSIYQIAIDAVNRQIADVARETKSTMESFAPHPTGAPRGKGSMSTGKTKATIAIEKRSDHEYFIHPTTEYAKFAEEGRGPVRARGKALRFIGSDGRVHYAREVAPMEGWHFVKRTAEIIRAKYGG